MAEERGSLSVYRCLVQNNGTVRAVMETALRRIAYIYRTGQDGRTSKAVSLFDPFLHLELDRYTRFYAAQRFTPPSTSPYQMFWYAITADWRSLLLLAAIAASCNGLASAHAYRNHSMPSYLPSDDRFNSSRFATSHLGTRAEGNTLCETIPFSFPVNKNANSPIVVSKGRPVFSCPWLTWYLDCDFHPASNSRQDVLAWLKGTCWLYRLMGLTPAES
jgi:hypothetical protein